MVLVVVIETIFEEGAGFEGVLDRGGKLLGVFDRGGGALASASAISSRYRSPWMRNGRPNSSSYFSRVFVSSAVTFGNSFAILFRIFSSLRSRVGSRFSPFWGFNISREAS